MFSCCTLCLNTDFRPKVLITGIKGTSSLLHSFVQQVEEEVSKLLFFLFLFYPQSTKHVVKTKMKGKKREKNPPQEIKDFIIL